MKKLGLDVGFGHTKYAFFNDKQEMVLGKIPSVIAFANVENTEVDEDDQLVKFERQNFYVGDFALKQNTKDIIELTEYSELRKYSPLLLLEAAQFSHINLDEFPIINSALSPAHKSYISDYRERLSSFESNGKHYKFDVSILPQGVGAVKALEYFAQEKQENMPKDYLVIDIGFNTIDIIFVYDGKIQKRRINEKHSFKQKGVMTIATMMIKKIETDYKRAITLKEALRVILSGKYTLRGNEYDLSQDIQQFKKLYTDDIMQLLETYYSNELDKMDEIHFVGGGGYFIDENYTNHIKKHKNSEYFNVIGNLLYEKE
ncbi:hypothetical protein CCZ01_09580 [Helicobacter monodelphidis]|uniref:ParM/StbA family protein n=1 Tax=Helicobacter sp. 15-1451 TaxID=2004995 RepID=UPI000DCC226D|nr:ParM/StbA family protein [Helicobacter sp. 15-1451]RAX56412.1 hypothetical protein CCZ01_09580 [Helicobacter sp. 15-1451]